MPGAYARALRAERNTKRWGTLDERADRVLAILRERGGVVSNHELLHHTRFPSGLLGGALSRLKERGEATRRGRRGWTAEP